MSLSLLTRQDRLLALRSRIDANGGGAVHLYAAPTIDSPETAAAAAPLAIVALSVPCGAIGVDLNGLATLAITPAVGNAAANGTVAWARYVDGAGTGVYDSLAGLPGSGAPVIITDGQAIPSANLFVGGEVQVNAAIFTE